MNNLPTSAIEKASQLIEFEQVPDYAIDALWIEWEKNRRRNPPDNMICTTIKSYQAFQQLVAFRDMEKFPSTFVDRSCLQCNGGGVFYPRGVRKDLPQILAQWPEEDDGVYVAFIYDGYSHQNTIKAAVDQISQHIPRLEGRSP